jgi:hypothetical protein
MESEDEEALAYYSSQAAYGSSDYETRLAQSGYNVDPELSSRRAKVFSKKGGKTYVAYKGTNPLNPNDLEADAAIALGVQKRHGQFVEASDLAKRVKTKYGDNVIATGHSLGGTKAIESANDQGLKAIVFNPGTGLAGLDTGKHKVFIKTGDPISSRVRGSNVAKSQGGHSLSGFENQFRQKSVVQSSKESHFSNSIPMRFQGRMSRIRSYRI